MLVSFLCPSRGRPESLRRSITSLEKHATDPTRFEVLVYLDDDDPMLPEYRTVAGTRQFTGPRGNGYRDLHLPIGNVLVPQATGTWLALWNDDATMETPAWDEVLANERPDAILGPATNHPRQAKPLGTIGRNVFPLVPRDWVTVAGWAQNGANDTWWEVVGLLVGSIRDLDWRVRHGRSDLTGEHADATRRENNYDPKTFFSLETYAKMGYAAGWIAARFPDRWATPVVLKW